jgi:peptidoglycan/xylan/chitin deacetylase (PgdA/CDA1 family)
LRLALKVDVDTLRGTLEGVPRIMHLLTALGVGATFYFSVGPDHTGRALKRALRPGFLKKVRRTSVLSHYGWRTLLYGTLLPGPAIGKRAGAVMRAVRAAGFEVGVHCYDHVRWQDGVATADAAWTQREFTRALSSFTEVFGTAPQSHAAAGWQLNPYALALETSAHLSYASDTRGTHAFLPVMGGISGECVQIPTTLPTLDELIGTNGLTADSVCDYLRSCTRAAGLPDQVFTLHAELEGGLLAPQFETLLRGWLEDGFALVPMRDLAASLQTSCLPHHVIDMGEIPGRSGVLALQGQRMAEAVSAC